MGWKMKDFKTIRRGSEYICFFCEDVLSIGDFVYGNHTDRDPATCRSFNNRRVTDELLGISLVDVVVIDMTKEHLKTYIPQVSTEMKINILWEGEIRMYLKPQRIPKGQPLYVSKKGKVTWRKHGPCIGEASSNQDEDGFIKIKVFIR